MLVSVLLFAVGLVLLIKGGDWFVDGATGIAKRFNLPDIVVGATVVSIGTTLPEVMVSTTGALAGSGAMAYGNAIGSIICNTALISAITIAAKPGPVSRKSLKLPVTFFFMAAVIYAATAYISGYFSRTIGLTLLWGVLINVVMATFFTYQILSLNYVLVIVLYFAGTLGCSYLVHKSDSPAVSFAGFTGMAVSMGLLLTYYVTAFSGNSVAYAFIATGLVTVIMIILSMLYPAFFQNLGRTLIISLLGCILVEFVGSILFRIPLGFIDYIVALTPAEIAAIPPTSILREFIDGQTL